MGWGNSRKIRQCRSIVAVIGILLVSACGSNSSSGSPASPETLVRESLKNIATYIAQGQSSLIGMSSGAASGTGRITSGIRSWECSERISYQDDCLSLTGTCTSEGHRLGLSGNVEFRECIRETALGLAVFTGNVGFQAAWDLPPSCVASAPDASCLAATVELVLSRPGNLSIQFAESDPLVITDLQALLEERWRLAGAGLWRISVAELSAVSGGRVFRCSGTPLVCTVTNSVAENPQPVNPACLDVPNCDSDAVCEGFLRNCPDSARLLDEFGYDLRCLDSQTRSGKSCLPQKREGPGSGDPPALGSCTRTGAWRDYCPITYNTTVNGEGLDCGVDADCQTPSFAAFYGSSPCSWACYNCQFNNFDCESCNACVLKHRCVSGCCAFDQDEDGYVAVGSAGGSYGDQILLAKQDNCEEQRNPDQADADLDCVGDVCDNCPSVANDQQDSDWDGVGDACDNCPIVPNGPRPRLVCDRNGCVEVPSQDNQNDSDGDGVGDACQGDYDGDGVPDEVDNCPRTQGTLPYSADQTDSDGDGVGDLCDNCRRTPNPDQTDLVDDYGNPFPDGRGDACQRDMDEDGVLNDADNCPFDYNPGQENSDGDPFGDACDWCPYEYSLENTPVACGEPDGDGVPNGEDNCPWTYNPGQEPFSEGGGRPGQACSYCLVSESPWGWDGDGDGWIDFTDCDNCPAVPNADQRDSDGDLIGDACDNCPFVANFGQRDSDFDGIGDACAFCDFNGICGESENYFNCAADCPAVCGNGLVESPAESCDDGNRTDGDGCDSNCTVTSCGNGIATAGESCGEPGLAACGEGLNCVQCVCKAPVCGDGFLDPGEGCDDGNLNPNDDCTDTCVPNVCGDGIVNNSGVRGLVEECDGDDSVCQNTPLSTRYCDNTRCRCAGFCGDGICDPAKETAANCYIDCQTCGDGICDLILDAPDCSDCARTPQTCGDRICGEGENIFNCFRDCRTGCGDGICDDRETPSSCYGDCRLCGDGYCDAGLGENADNCAEDFCGFASESCGDGVCENTFCDETTPTCEFLRTCYVDCAGCGDGLCDPGRGEDASNCTDCMSIRPKS